MYIEAVLHFENIDTIGLVKSAVFAKIKAKTFHVLPSNRNKLQKVTPRSLLPPYVRLMFTIKKKHSQNPCKCLIFTVDQTGLEPVTSRL